MVRLNPFHRPSVSTTSESTYVAPNDRYLQPNKQTIPDATEDVNHVEDGPKAGATVIATDAVYQHLMLVVLPLTTPV